MAWGHVLALLKSLLTVLIDLLLMGRNEKCYFFEETGIKTLAIIAPRDANERP